MIIRHEHSQDIERITEIQYAAFKDHPMHAPGVEPTEQLLVQRLRESRMLTVSLLAEIDGRSVGHIAISPTVVGATQTGWFILGPVGVLPEFQGQGIGSALIREVMNRAQLIGAQGIVLVGDPAFYARFGFESIPGLKYEGVPDQYVMGVSFSSANPHGLIKAHKAFHETE